MTFPVLCTRIKSSEVEEYKQLTCVMQFFETPQQFMMIMDPIYHPHHKVHIQYTLTYRATLS